MTQLEGKGFFTKEIEEALLSGETDIAVHSHKDLPTESPEELTIAAVSDREDPSELLLIRKEAVDPGRKFCLKKNAIVGTSSARRKSQLLAFCPDIILKDLRGNVSTRVNKLREGLYDAILIAAVGVSRLELNLEELENETKYFVAPAETSADTFMLSMVKSKHCLLVSNDTFRNYKIKDSWLAANIDYFRLTFMITDEGVIMPEL